MKKILILSVTAGNGHNACARCMKNKLEEIAGEEVEVKVVDLLKTFSINTKIKMSFSCFTHSVVIYFVFIHEHHHNHYIYLSSNILSW